MRGEYLHEADARGASCLSNCRLKEARKKSFIVRRLRKVIETVFLLNQRQIARNSSSEDANSSCFFLNEVEWKKTEKTRVFFQDMCLRDFKPAVDDVQKRQD